MKTLWDLGVGDRFFLKNCPSMLIVTHKYLNEKSRIVFKDMNTEETFSFTREQAKEKQVRTTWQNGSPIQKENGYVGCVEYPAPDLNNWSGTAEIKEGDTIRFTNCKVLGIQVGKVYKEILDGLEEEKPVELLIYSKRQSQCPGCQYGVRVNMRKTFNTVKDVKFPHIRFECTCCGCWWVEEIKYKGKSVQPLWSKIVWKVWDGIVFTSFAGLGYWLSQSGLL